jgi:hydroxymethylpyrimidine pyrophosphatase-like HAD family hydrolase
VDFAVCLQGALILDSTLSLQTAEATAIPVEAAKRVQELADQGLEVWAYDDSRWYVSAATSPVERESELLGFAPDGDLSDVPAGDVLKFVCYGAIESRQRLRRVARECGLLLYDSHYTPKDIYIEVVSESVPRAKGLGHVQLRFGRPHDFIVAVGDSYNDYEMLKLADRAYTFTNSVLAAESDEFVILPPASDRGLLKLVGDLDRLIATRAGDGTRRSHAAGRTGGKRA